MSEQEPAASFGDVCSILREVRSTLHSRPTNDVPSLGFDEARYVIELLDRLEKGSWWKDIPRRL